MNPLTLWTSVRGRLTLVGLALLGVIVSSLWLSLRELDLQRHDARIVNVAGRQRMLVTRAVGHLVEAGLTGDAAARRAWRRDAGEFERTLDVLVEGGTISLAGDTVTLPRDPDSPLLPHRPVVEEAWSEVRRLAPAVLSGGSVPEGGPDGPPFVQEPPARDTGVISGGQGSGEGRPGIRAIRRAADTVLLHLDRAVADYQAVATERVRRLRLLQLGFGGAGVVLLVLAAGWVRGGVLRPLQRLEDAAERMETGDLSTFVDRTGPREIAAVSGALDDARETLGRMIEEQAALATLADAVLAGRDVETVAQTACEAVGRILHAGGIGVWIRNAQTGRLERMGAWGWVREWPEGAERGPDGQETDLERVARTGAPLFRTRLRADDDPPPPEPPLLQGAASAAVLPLVAGGSDALRAGDRHVHGVLAVYRSSVEPLPDPDASFLSLVARETGLAVQTRAAEEALQRSERVLQSLLEMAPDGIVVIDEKQQIVRLNRAAEDLFGYKDEELVGRPLDRLLPEARRAAHRRHVRAFAAGGERTRMMASRDRVQGKKKDGTTFPLEASIGRIEIGERTRFMALVRDITDRLEMREQAEEGRRISALTTMAAGIAHHFNNRLTVLRGHADLALLDLPEDHPLRDDVEAIVEDAEGAARMAEQILAFAGGRKGRKRSVVLQDVVRRGLESFLEPRGPDEPIEVRLPDHPVEVRADPAHLQEALRELLENAHDATMAGGAVRVVLESVRGAAGTEAGEDEGVGPRDSPRESGGDEGPRTWVSLRVEDTGPGMDGETLAHCREPFFSTKGAEHATGLGLSTVHGIVREMGGRLEVRSQPGEGTVVEMRLPVIDPGGRSPSDGERGEDS